MRRGGAEPRPPVLIHCCASAIGPAPVTPYGGPANGRRGWVTCTLQVAGLRILGAEGAGSARGHIGVISAVPDRGGRNIGRTSVLHRRCIQGVLGGDSQPRRRVSLFDGQPDQAQPGLPRHHGSIPASAPRQTSGAPSGAFGRLRTAARSRACLNGKANDVTPPPASAPRGNTCC